MGNAKDDPYGMIRTMMIMVFPKIAKLLNIPFINIEATDFIVGIIR
jgi:hypothetical protein